MSPKERKEQQMKVHGKKLFALLLCLILCCSFPAAYADRIPRVADSGSVAAPNSSGGMLGLNVYRYGSEIEADYSVYSIGWNRNVKLRVKADGGGSKTYQWFTLNYEDYSWDGTDWVFSDNIKPIPGATKSSYTIPVATDMDYDLFACTVTDQNGDDASAIFEVYCNVVIADADFYSTPSGVAA